MAIDFAFKEKISCGTAQIVWFFGLHVHRHEEGVLDSTSMSSTCKLGKIKAGN